MGGTLFWVKFLSALHEDFLTVQTLSHPEEKHTLRRDPLRRSGLPGMQGTFQHRSPQGQCAGVPPSRPQVEEGLAVGSDPGVGFLPFLGCIPCRCRSQFSASLRDGWGPRACSGSGSVFLHGCWHLLAGSVSTEPGEVPGHLWWSWSSAPTYLVPNRYCPY